MSTQRIMADIENTRRERAGVDTIPTSLAPDYSESITNIEIAVKTLAESLPNGQKLRTELAFSLLEANVNSLRAYLQVKGHALKEQP